MSIRIVSWLTCFFEFLIKHDKRTTSLPFLSVTTRKGMLFPQKMGRSLTLTAQLVARLLRYYSSLHVAMIRSSKTNSDSLITLTFV